MKSIKSAVVATWLSVLLSAEASAAWLNVVDAPNWRPSPVLGPWLKSTLAPEDDYQSCQFQEMPLRLASRARAFSLLSTQKACGWGAASAPLWLVQQTPQGPRLLLEAPASHLHLKARRRHGLPDLSVVVSTAGTYTESRYRFNGYRYEHRGSFFR